MYKRDRQHVERSGAAARGQKEQGSGTKDLGPVHSTTPGGATKRTTGVSRHRPTHFLHIFATDAYAAGYYSYMWAEVLDADGFKAFTETGDAFDPEIAKRLYDHIYSAGGTRDYAAAYRSFRGRDPDIAALLEGRGLKAA